MCALIGLDGSVRWYDCSDEASSVTFRPHSGHWQAMLPPDCDAGVSRSIIENFIGAIRSVSAEVDVRFMAVSDIYNDRVTPLFDDHCVRTTPL